MSRRSARGFTLLEVEVAMLVLMLTVLMVTRLLASHERLVAGLARDARIGATLHVVPPAAPYEDVAGVPASLSATAVPPPKVARPKGRRTLTVLAVVRTLSPPAAAATVEVAGP